MCLFYLCILILNSILSLTIYHIGEKAIIEKGVVVFKIVMPRNCSVLLKTDYSTRKRR